MTARKNDFVTGKTIRLAWKDGPTKGSMHDHVFHSDGKVEWKSVHKDGGPADASSAKGAAKPEKVPYAAFLLGDDACMFSYLSHSGYTLTVAMRLSDGSVVGIASNDKTWGPIHGAFEVVG